MARILDLSVFGKQTLDIKLPDEKTVLHLRKPTQEMVIVMIDYKNLPEDAEAEEIIRRINVTSALILRTNDVGMAISDQYVIDELNTAQKVAICQYYAAWIAEVQSDPNSLPPPSQTNAE